VADLRREEYGKGKSEGVRGSERETGIQRGGERVRERKIKKEMELQSTGRVKEWKRGEREKGDRGRE
jgi:hypothetical protein